MALRKLQTVAKIVGETALETKAAELQADGAGIKVCIRVRPFIREELEGDRSGGKTECCIEMPTETCTVMKREDEERRFEYDRCYWSHSRDHPLYATQQTLQEELGETMLSHAMNGFNNCIFAYGQTGSGKSYSVLGGAGEDRGLLPRIVEGLFDRFRELPSSVKQKTLVSFMQIYNEDIRDLLGASGPGGKAPDKKLDVRLHPTLGLTIPGLTETPVDSCQSVMELVEFGMENRMVSATAMNATSSRSHCIFTFKTSLVEPDGTNKMSQTHLVDLAGSERAGRTKAEGDRLKEGAAINKSLSTLARVISELAKANGKKKTNPPFRDSKLTYVLKESLCGNSKTVMMAAISPNVIDFEETLSTMKFCQQVKLVQTKAVANTSNENGIEAMLRKEAEELKAKLALLEANQAGPGGGFQLPRSGSGEDSEWSELKSFGQMETIKQRLQQTEMLSKFYGKEFDVWVAEETKRNAKRKTIRGNFNQQDIQAQLQGFAATLDSHNEGNESESDASSIADKASRSEYVLCYCITKPDASRTAILKHTGRSDSGIEAYEATAEKSKISITGPLAQEMLQNTSNMAVVHHRMSIGTNRPAKPVEPTDFMEKSAERKTQTLADCWILCGEAETAAARLSVPSAPKMTLIPHVAVRPDDIELDCQVIVLVEQQQQGQEKRVDWMTVKDLKPIVAWLKATLAASGLVQGENGTDENAWETAMAACTLATKREVNALKEQLSQAPRRSHVNILEKDLASKDSQLQQANDQLNELAELQRKLQEMRANNDRLERSAAELSSSKQDLMARSEELRQARRQVDQLEGNLKRLQTTSENQNAGLDMQRKELSGLRQEAVEARMLQTEVKTLRDQLTSAEESLGQDRRNVEDTRSLRERLSKAEGELAFAMSQVGEVDQLKEEYQQASGQLRILQARDGEADRLRKELDVVQDHLHELNRQKVLAAQEAGGDRTNNLAAELAAAEAELAFAGSRAEEAARLRTELAEGSDELHEAKAKADMLKAEFAAMQQTLHSHKSKVEEGNRIRGEFQAAEQELRQGRAAVVQADRLRSELAQAQRDLSDAQHSLAASSGARSPGLSEAERRAAAEKNAEVARLRAELSAVQSKAARADDLHSEVVELRSQHVSQKGFSSDAVEADELRSELGSLKAELYGHQRRISNAADLRTNVAALQTELTEKHNLLHQLESQVAAASPSSIRAPADSRDDAADSLRVELEDARAQARIEADSLRAQIAKVQDRAAQAERLEVRLRLLQGAQEENGRLRSEVASMEFQVEHSVQSAGAADRLRSELETTRRELSSARAAAAVPSPAPPQLSEDGERLRGELVRIRGQLAVAQDELGRVGPEATKLRGDVARLQAQLEATQRQLTAERPEARRLRTELASAQGQLGVTREQLAVAEATSQAHKAASNMLLEASGANGSARSKNLAGVIASSFEAAIDAIETAKQELIKEGAASAS